MKCLLMFFVALAILFLAACGDQYNDCDLTDGYLTQSVDINENVIPSEIISSSINIELPMRDENTQIINITFPETNGLRYAIKPYFVYPSQFEFEGYMPFVKYTSATIGSEPIFVYRYAFLHSNAWDLTVGNFYYDLLNRKYAQERQVTDGFHPRTIEVLDFHYRSRIIYISQDGQRVVNYSQVHPSSGEIPPFFEKIEIFEGDTLLFSYQREISQFSIPIMPINFFDLENIIEIQGRYIKTYGSYPLNFPSFFLLEHTHYVAGIGLLQVAYVYETYENSKLRVSYILEMPQASAVRQLIDGKYVLLENAGVGYFLFNLATQEFRFLGRFGFSDIMPWIASSTAILSPDMRFIAFTGMDRFDYWSLDSLMDADTTYVNDWGDGFYVKNLETGQTVFYQLENDKYGSFVSRMSYSVIGWVNKQGIEKLLGFEILP